MKYLRKFDSVQGLNEAVQGAQISFMGLAYDNGTPVIGNKVVQPVPPTPAATIAVYVVPNNLEYGTVNGSDVVTYENVTAGTTIQVTAVGFNPYVFVKWRDVFTDQPITYTSATTNPLQLTFTAEIVNELYNNWGSEWMIQADFGVPNVQVSAVSVPYGVGVFGGNDGLVPYITSSVTYNSITAFVVHHTDSEHYHFDGWSWSEDPNDPIVHGGDYFSFTADTDKTAYAHYSLIQG